MPTRILHFANTGHGSITFADDLAAFDWMQDKSYPLPAIARIVNLVFRSVQRGAARTGIDLGLDSRDVKFRQLQSLPPADQEARSSDRARSL